MRRLTYRLSDGEKPQRIQDYLRRAHGYSYHIVTWLKKEPDRVLVDGRPVSMVRLLSPGEELSVTLYNEHNPEIEPSGIEVPVLYEDEDLMVFDKPYDMPVHPSHHHQFDTLANVYARLCAERGEPFCFRVLNRLDRNTSGLVLVARHSYAACRMADGAKKEYLAVACGEIPGDGGDIDAPIGREEGSIITRRVSEIGQPALTHYEVLRRGGGYTAVRIWLETGRTHQIRVHFAYLGYPLAGDDLYGGSCEKISRHALHCFRMQVCNRITGQGADVEAPLPADMQALLREVMPLDKQEEEEVFWL